MIVRKNQPPFSSAGLACMIAGIIVFFASIITYFVYYKNANIFNLLIPGANQTFMLAALGLRVSFLLAAIAFICSLASLLTEKTYPISIRNGRTIPLAITSLVLVLMSAHFIMISYGSSNSSETLAKLKALEQNIDVRAGKVDATNTNTFSVPVTVTNKRSVPTDYIIVIDAFNKYGYKIGQDSIYTQGLGANSSRTFKIFQSFYTKLPVKELENATFKVNNISQK